MISWFSSLPSCGFLGGVQIAEGFLKAGADAIGENRVRLLGIRHHLKRAAVGETDGQILIEPAGHRQQVDRLDAGEIGGQQGQASREATTAAVS